MHKIKQITDAIYPVSSQSIQQMNALLEISEYKKGDTFIEKGKRDRNEYFVLQGICRSYVLNPEGEEITIAFYTGNSILSPFVTRTENGLSVLSFQSLTQVTLAAMDAYEFEHLMVGNLEIRAFGNTVLRNELKRKVDKEIGLASLTAKERLIQFRKDYPMLENLIPHPAIASYLGITNISLSRLRGDLT